MWLCDRWESARREAQQIRARARPAFRSVMEGTGYSSLGFRNDGGRATEFDVACPCPEVKCGVSKVAVGTAEYAKFEFRKPGSAELRFPLPKDSRFTVQGCSWAELSMRVGVRTLLV